MTHLGGDIPNKDQTYPILSIDKRNLCYPVLSTSTWIFGLRCLWPWVCSPLSWTSQAQESSIQSRLYYRCSHDSLWARQLGYVQWPGRTAILSSLLILLWPTSHGRFWRDFFWNSEFLGEFRQVFFSNGQVRASYLSNKQVMVSYGIFFNYKLTPSRHQRTKLSSLHQSWCCMPTFFVSIEHVHQNTWRKDDLVNLPQLASTRYQWAATLIIGKIIQNTRKMILTLSTPITYFLDERITSRYN